MVVDDLKPTTIAPILRENMSREARLATDEAGHYLHVGKEFADHGIVRHGKEEYVVGDVHTNTLEGYFSGVQARDEGRIPALREAASASLPCGVRFPVQQ